MKREIQFAALLLVMISATTTLSCKKGKDKNRITNDRIMETHRSYQQPHL